MSINPIPKRGEIWLVNFDPTIGTEIKKIRPAIVVSSDAVGKLPTKLAAPIADWKDYFAQNLWHIKLDPDAINNLTSEILRSQPVRHHPSEVDVRSGWSDRERRDRCNKTEKRTVLHSIHRLVHLYHAKTTDDRPSSTAAS